MKSQKFINDQIQIKGKTKNSEWNTHLIDVKLPQKTFFYLNAPYLTSKKVEWSFGDGTKNMTITNRKMEPTEKEITHYFREKNCKDITTLYVNASVFTDSFIYVTTDFTIEFDPVKINNYVDPNSFKKQIEIFYDTDELSDDLALSIQQIATRFSYSPNWINYPCREDLVGDAIIKMIQALRDKKFDPNKGNPFSYFTKIAYHAFCHRIKLEKKGRLAVEEYQDFVYNTMMCENNIVCTHNKEFDENDY